MVVRSQVARFTLLDDPLDPSPGWLRKHPNATTQEVAVFASMIATAATGDASMMAGATTGGVCFGDGSVRSTFVLRQPMPSGAIATAIANQTARRRR